MEVTFASPSASAVVGAFVGVLQLGEELWNWLRIDELWDWLVTVPPGLLGIVGVIIGVLGTQLFNRLSSRPKPLIFIDHLKIDRSESPPGSLAEITEDADKLMVELREDPFISEIPLLSSKMKESEYVNGLERALREIEEALDRTLPLVQDVARRLRDYASQERFESFRNLWAEEQRVIWLLLTMAVLRKDKSWNDTSTSDSSSDDQLDEAQSADANENDVIDYDDYNNMYVHLSPPPVSRTLYFPWSGQRALTEGASDPITPVARYIEQVRVSRKKEKKIQRLAQETARAVAERDEVEEQDKKHLQNITNFVYNETKTYREQLDILRKKVQRELRKHDRLTVQGQISNIGGSPFSVLNEGKLFVQTKGHPYTEGDGDNRAQSYYEEDEEITIMLPNGEGRYDVPVSIAKGEAYRFTAVSAKRFEELPRPQVLRVIFRAGGKSSYMGVPVILPGRSPRRRSIEYTPLRFFGDWKTNPYIPPRRQLSHSLKAWLVRKLQDNAVDR